MCAEMEQIYSEGMESGIEKGIIKGMEQGELKKAKETAVSLAEMGLSVEKIAKAVKISKEVIKEWLHDGVNVKA